MKYAQLACMAVFCLSLQINNNRMSAEGGIVGRVIRGSEWTRFVTCCVRKLCPFVYGLPVGANACRVMFYRGNNISCKCVKPDKNDNGKNLIRPSEFVNKKGNSKQKEKEKKRNGSSSYNRKRVRF